MQQAEQRGVSSLQSAVSAASNGVTRPAMTGSPTPAQQAAFGQQGYGAADLKRGGPVEFNHAISYVNKIKVRSTQPRRQNFQKTFTDSHLPESIRPATRNLQTISGDSSNLPTRVEAYTRRLRTSHPALSLGARSSRRLQAIST